jgi:hypothetical protein
VDVRQSHSVPLHPVLQENGYSNHGYCVAVLSEEESISHAGFAERKIPFGGIPAWCVGLIKPGGKELVTRKTLFRPHFQGSHQRLINKSAAKMTVEQVPLQILTISKPKRPLSTLSLLLFVNSLTILSKDGGGYQGIASLLMLDALIENVARGPEGKQGPNGKPIKPCDMFDVIGGVGSGGSVFLSLNHSYISF